MRSPVLPIVVVGGIFIALLMMPDAKDNMKNVRAKIFMVLITILTIAIKAYVVHCLVSSGGTCPMYAWWNTLLICLWMITASALLLHKKLITDE
jgi:hypothetical protein